MLAEAGFPKALDGAGSDAVIDSGVLWGNEERVAQRLHGLFGWGASQIIASPVGAGPDRAASAQRTLLARVAQSP